MSKTTEKKGKPSAPAGSTAGEAWDLLASLVYPPPFLAIAQELGLRPATLGALRILDEPRTMSEIAAFLRCDNSNVTGIVDGLETRGLAERTSAPGDRRVKLIALTVEGRRLRARLMREARKPPAWLKNLSAADQRTLRDLLRRATA
ncbi:MAG TPA: MarR family transcriptional regulator [Solirubrobacterales bacterium]|nr:MarR family transcriptional regulator [Solirubrobacterales bacterium]